MSYYNGKCISFTIFGQSHSEAIGVTVDGLPSGEKLYFDKLNHFLERRAPGNNEFSTPRKEADKPEFLSGLSGNTISSEPLTAIIKNTNTRPSDYSALKNTPRPSHADYTARVKFGDNEDTTGGGHFSGRMTAPLCIVGGICKQLLEKENIKIISRIKSVGNISDNGALDEDISYKSFPIVDDAQGEKMKSLILKKKSEGDSVGGVVECSILGLPVGLGGALFDGMEGRISQVVFAIPAVKGIEFGAGFESSKMTGSENNDEFYIDNGEVKTRTNNCGGILGGITNGMPLNFSVAFKPTPSIAKKQNTVDLEKMENTTIEITGRHDPCIVLRAVPCVEAAAAIVIYDELRRKEHHGA